MTFRGLSVTQAARMVLGLVPRRRFG